MRGIMIGAALSALAAGAARAETCRGGPGDVHLVRVGSGPAPLFFGMAWNGPPKMERAVAVRCLGGSGPDRPGRKDRRGR